jgi:hypothetical protein
MGWRWGFADEDDDVARAADESTMTAAARQLFRFSRKLYSLNLDLPSLPWFNFTSTGPRTCEGLFARCVLCDSLPLRIRLPDPSVQAPPLFSAP